VWEARDERKCEVGGRTLNHENYLDSHNFVDPISKIYGVLFLTLDYLEERHVCAYGVTLLQLSSRVPWACGQDFRIRSFVSQAYRYRRRKQL
jgi:hypothetical protein